MNTLWSRYGGLIRTKHDISNGIILTDNLKDEPELVKTLLSCLRTGELPLYNGTPIVITSFKL